MLVWRAASVFLLPTGPLNHNKQVRMYYTLLNLSLLFGRKICCINAQLSHTSTRFFFRFSFSLRFHNFHVVSFFKGCYRLSSSQSFPTLPVGCIFGSLMITSMFYPFFSVDSSLPPNSLCSWRSPLTQTAECRSSSRQSLQRTICAVCHADISML